MKRTLLTIIVACLAAPAMHAQSPCTWLNPNDPGYSAWMEMDCDGDGIKNINETFGDSDNDGLDSFADIDSDGDNTLDAYEAYGDGFVYDMTVRGNSHPNTIYHASYQTGTLPTWADNGNNGSGLATPNFLVGGSTYYFDTDNDGVVDLYDPNNNGSSIMPSATYLNSSTSANPLPVSFISFSAQKTTQDVKLVWETAYEKNNNFFQIERSGNGKDFVSLSRIYGKGNSNNRVAYDFSDSAPLSGDSYYRLRQVDFDGTESFSQIVAVRLEKDINRPQIALYPSILSSDLTIEIHQKQTTELEVNIFDSKGSLVSRHVIVPNQQTAKIPVTALPVGAYFISVSGLQEQFSQRVVKL